MIDILKNNLVEKTLKRISEFETPFCPVPFTTLILNPTGIVGSCRELGSQHQIGNIKEQTISEIWNGKIIQSWRNEFLTGKIRTCKKNIQHKSCNRLPDKKLLLKYVELSKIQTGPIKALSPDFNSKCNLKCAFCHIWQGPNGLYDYLEDFWHEAKIHIFSNLAYMEPLAGEPFIQKDFYKIIDIMEQVNPTCIWKMTTNGNWNFTPFIKEKLDKINIDIISVSLDSIRPNSYKTIRSGDLEKTLKNIDDLIIYRNQRASNNRPFELQINATIQRENWDQIPELINFCKNKGVVPFIQYVYNPSKYSLSTLDLNERKRIIKNYLSTFTAEEIMSGHRVVRALIDTFSSNEKEKYITLCDSITNGYFLKILY